MTCFVLNIKTLSRIGPAQAGRWDFLGYYELLGLKAQAGSGGRSLSESEIKRAYREAAKRWHPDRREGLAEHDRGAAHQRFQVGTCAAEPHDIRLVVPCLQAVHQPLAAPHFCLRLQH